ncbi:hypothetical protein SAMN06265182_1232 [Persephonella hydrogeniphila]|uniref:Uncharacterized protein n=1 Tax=Persephonella hydrogeniphila TaxID=198703 RepID=A0A285NK38_9AQUI|nr:hypothetical protein [Persephonella hydrogeniphila]SNZ08246.1 hypothetical protein SAMN06265182_1232 [Persephonella hydrogeniphila]
MKDIVLDFGNHQMYLSGKYYTHQISGDLVLVECAKGTGKRWVYSFKGFTVNEKEIRFLVKEEEPPRMRLLPKQAKTHAK